MFQLLSWPGSVLHGITGRTDSHLIINTLVIPALQITWLPRPLLFPVCLCLPGWQGTSIERNNNRQQSLITAWLVLWTAEQVVTSLQLFPSCPAVLWPGLALTGKQLSHPNTRVQRSPLAMDRVCAASRRFVNWIADVEEVCQQRQCYGCAGTVQGVQRRPALLVGWCGCCAQRVQA